MLRHVTGSEEESLWECSYTKTGRRMGIARAFTQRDALSAITETGSIRMRVPIMGGGSDRSPSRIMQRLQLPCLVRARLAVFIADPRTTALPEYRMHLDERVQAGLIRTPP